MDAIRELVWEYHDYPEWRDMLSLLDLVEQLLRQQYRIGAAMLLNDVGTNGFVALLDLVRTTLDRWAQTAETPADTDMVDPTCDRPQHVNWAGRCSPACYICPILHAPHESRTHKPLADDERVGGRERQRPAGWFPCGLSQWGLVGHA